MIFVFGSDPNPILGLGFQAFLFSGYLLFIYSYDSGITSAFVPSLELVPLLFMLIAYPISAFPRLFTVAFCAQNWRDHLNMSWAAIENDPGKLLPTYGTLEFMRFHHVSDWPWFRLQTSLSVPVFHICVSKI